MMPIHVTGKKNHKYRAVKTVVDGITFASKKEARRYSELLLLQKAGEIWGLELQPKFPMTVNGVPIGSYVADFSYFAREDVNRCDSYDKCVQVVEDCKGVKTPVYKLKKRIVEAIYGFKIKET